METSRWLLLVLCDVNWIYLSFRRFDDKTFGFSESWCAVTQASTRIDLWMCLNSCSVTRITWVPLKASLTSWASHITKWTLWDVQRARWIQPSARSSPAAPRPSCHLWPGDRPRWPPHIHHRWWRCPRCPSTFFPELWLHHWGGRSTGEWSQLQHQHWVHSSCLTCSQTWCIWVTMLILCDRMHDHQNWTDFNYSCSAWSLAAWINQLRNFTRNFTRSFTRTEALQTADF